MKQCDKVADYRYTWPGRDESFICSGHVGKLRAVSERMGFYLQITKLVWSLDNPLSIKRCQQKIDD